MHPTRCIGEITHGHRGALDRLGPRDRTARTDLAPGSTLVPRELPVLLDPDRVRRAVARPLARLDDPRRHPRHPDRYGLHGVSRGAGPDARAAADDPVAGPV